MSGTPYLIGTAAAANGNTGTVTLNVAHTTTNGDSIVVGIGTTDTGDDPVSVTDTQGNGYTELEGPTGSNAISGSVWQADGTSQLVSGVDQIIVTLPNTAATAAIAVGDNNVGVTLVAEDQNISGTGLNVGPNSGATLALDQSYEHAIAFIVDLAAGGVPTWNSPWNANVLGNVVDSGTTVRCSAAYQDVTSNIPLEATGTIASTSWTCMLVTNNVTNLQIQNNSIPNGVVDQIYTVAFSTIGGIGSVTYSLTAGTLPPGLSLASNTLAGTPTAAGTYDFTITANASTFGPATSQTYTMTILPQQVSGVPQATLYGNLLSASDANGLVGGSWVQFLNASAVTLTPRQALSGANSFLWSATTNGTTAIQTKQYTVQPNKAYVVSTAMLPLGGVRNLYIGVKWLNSNGTTIAISGGPNATIPTPTVSQGSFWTPVVNTVTSPPTAVKAQVIIWCDSTAFSSVLAGEPTFIDQTFFTQSNIQISIDFENPPFTPVGKGITPTPAAGSAFFDITPWVRQDVGVQYTRGRQDAISEVQAGSATFSLQNDQGTFTPFNSGSFLAFMGAAGASPTLQQRIQINFADKLGNWSTRYDGLTSEIDYTFDNTGNTSVAQYQCTDVLGYLNRQPSLRCWTYQEILSDTPLYFWPLDDYDQVQSIVSFNQNTLQQTVNLATSGFSVAAEVAGFNGPPMRVSDRSSVILSGAVIAWADTTYGVETLADSVQPIKPDGSEFWTAGTDQPNSQLRGLDSGNVGPFTTPLPNVSFAPVIAPSTAKNNWIGNQGWELVATFPGTQALQTNANDYTFELFFMSNPALAEAVNGVANSPFWTQNLGPFICMGIGNSRNLHNIAAGIFVGGQNGTTFQVNTYTNPPAWNVRSFQASPIGPTGSMSTPYTPDTNGLPHHLVIIVQGGEGGVSASITAYLDGVQLTGNINIPINEAYDTLSVGGPHGGSGNWYGSLSCCAVYDYALSPAQITEHCQRGQYGAWEQATDQCIVELSEYANIPSYWMNIPASDTVGATNALSLTEYVDITGSNAVSSFQLYEQAEHGLFFINASGQVSFLTRDWKMGYGGPDLFLPPDTFDGTAVGYELVDQFQSNEQAISSITFPTGGSFVNQASTEQYGVYAQNPIGSPLQLPVITFNRAYAVLGLPSLTYYADPYINDLCSWTATSRGLPFFTAASVTVDLLALDNQSGLSVADFYNLEIGMMIAPSGTIPESFPNDELITNWFIEGITETFSTSQHTIQYYTSPAQVQEAWKLGDPVYGVSGETTTLGISAVDTNPIEADGKDVSHDAGPPYWPPTFVDNIYFDDTIQLLPIAYWPLNDPLGADFSGSNFNLSIAPNPDGTPNANSATFMVLNSPVMGSGSCVQLFSAAKGGLVATTFSPSAGSQWSFECWFNLNNMPQITALNPNPRIFASSHTTADNCGFEIYLANGTTPTFVIGNGTSHATIAASPITDANWHYLLLTWDGAVNDVVNAYVDFVQIGNGVTFSGSLGASTGSVTIGAGTYGGDFFNGLVAQCAIYQQQITSPSPRQIDAQTPGMNNPIGNGNFFVGNNDMRGIVWPLQKMLTPPMCVMGQQTQSFSFAEGSLADPTMPWDTVYNDTEGGMGLIPQWPNWYVVTVPGFYEVDANVEVSINDSNNSGQAWIIVAEQAAQQLQANIGTPITNLRYVYPVGETKKFANVAAAPGASVNLCPSWRGYLGAGDMVAVGFEHNMASTNISTTNNNAGSWFSLRWTGLSNTGDDRAQVCSTINGGTIVNPAGNVGITTTSWTNTGSFTYTQPGKSPGTIANRNGPVWQGNDSPPKGNMQYAQLPFNFTAINASLLNAEIVNATLTATNLTTNKGAGGKVIALIGLYYQNTAKNPWSPIFSGPHFDAIQNLVTPVFKTGQTLTVTLPSSFFGSVGGTGDVAKQAFSGKCSGFLLGNDNYTANQYNGSFKGVPGTWTLTVQYRI